MSAQRSIRLYRFVQDAWEDALSTWLREHAGSCLTGAENWLVVGDAAQAAWIRRRAASDGLTLLGIRFLTAAGLRRELSRRLGIETRLLGRESLEFLLRLEALKHKSAEARSVALNPGPCLKALDDLGRAGWTGNETDLGEIPSPAGNWLKILASSHAWTSSIDKELITAARTVTDPALHLFFWAWDAEFYSEKMLLEAALETSVGTDFCLPQPGIDFEMTWVEELERLCACGHSVCPATEFRSVHENLVEHLFRRGESTLAPAVPLLLSGKTMEDQAALAGHQILKWLPGCATDERIGVVTPAGASVSRLLLQRLTDAGVAVHDEAGGHAVSDVSVVLQQGLADYHLSGGMVEEFLTLLAAAQVPDSSVKLPDPVRARSVLYKIFGSRPTRRMPVLVEHIESHSRGELTELRDLVTDLGEWPEEALWQELKSKWQSCASRVGTGVERLEPLWSRLDAVLEGRTVSGRVFLEYVRTLLEPVEFKRDERNNLPYAKVIFTTPLKACDQDWKHLLFLDSNEGVWPSQSEENPFLSDELKRHLNRRSGSGSYRLITASDHSRLEQKKLMSLLENCSGEAAFLAQGSDTLDTAKELHPNEWFLQCLMLQDDAIPVLQRWKLLQQSDVTSPFDQPSPMRLPPAEAAHLAEVRHRRCDPNTAFDEFSFCYPPDAMPERFWAVTGLENAGERPATFALRELFGVTAAATENFERSERWITGILVHQWIGLCLKDGLVDVWEMDERMNQIEIGLRRDFGAGSSLWWETVFQSSRWAVRQCLAMLRRRKPGACTLLRTEETIRGVVQTPGGDLRLRGRLDFTARNTEDWPGADVWIVDFKTGRTQLPTSSQLESGNGMQFGAYLLLAEAAGVKTVEVQCLSPRASGTRVLTLTDAGAARNGLAPVAGMLNALRFGMRGPLRSAHQRTEELPMSTVPVSPDILQLKAEKTPVKGVAS